MVRLWSQVLMRTSDQLRTCSSVKISSIPLELREGFGSFGVFGLTGLLGGGFSTGTIGLIDFAVEVAVDVELIGVDGTDIGLSGVVLPLERILPTNKSRSASVIFAMADSNPGGMKSSSSGDSSCHDKCKLTSGHVSTTLGAAKKPDMVQGNTELPTSLRTFLGLGSGSSVLSSSGSVKSMTLFKDGNCLSVYSS